jgi:predicted NAD-dependent protein-ADP-ribosyltransferase YbiA (DUF1768 family)
MPNSYRIDGKVVLTRYPKVKEGDLDKAEAFRKALADSGDKFIIEDESNRKKKPDSWGAVLDTTSGEYYGKNIMGRLLMELREKGVLTYANFEF